MIPRLTTFMFIFIVSLRSFVLPFVHFKDNGNYDMLDNLFGRIAFRFWHKNAEFFLHNILHNLTVKNVVNHGSVQATITSRSASPSIILDVNRVPLNSSLKSLLIDNAVSFSSNQICIQHIQFSSREKRFFNEFQNCNKWPFSHRTSMFISVLQSIVDHHPDLILQDEDFDFYVDVSVATCIDVDLFKALGRPLLSQSIARHSGDKYTLPFPDAYQIAVFNLWMNWSHPSHMTADYRSWVSGIAKRYEYGRFEKPWSEKLHGVIYCGTNVSTFQPHHRHESFYPRQQVHDMYSSRDHGSGNSNSSSNSSSNSNSKTDSNSSISINLMKHGKVHLNPVQMGKGWRFQLNIDGFGTSYDGTAWKLGSNSTVLYIIPDPVLQQVSRDYYKVHGSFKAIPMMWEGWYSNHFSPNEHYISIAPDQIEEALQWCSINKQKCEQIAINSRKMTEDVINPHAMYSYMGCLLKYLQDCYIEAREKYRMRTGQQQ